jgi:hypothetical protein
VCMEGVNQAGSFGNGYRGFFLFSNFNYSSEIALLKPKFEFKWEKLISFGHLWMTSSQVLVMDTQISAK